MQSRRSVLGLTMSAAMAFGFSPRRVLAQASGPGRVMEALSAYMSAARTRALPDDVIEQAKYHLLDTLAAMISGSELPPGQAAQRYIRAHGGKGATTIAGSALTAAPIDAALANGVMAHADETDDSHNASRSHPGCAVVPAALAVGEDFGIDGARSPARRDARLRHRHARDDGHGGRRVQLRKQLGHAQHRRDLWRRGRGGLRRQLSMRARCAGLLDYTAQQSSGIAAWRRDTDHIEKAFVFARHAGAQRRHRGAAGAIGLERRRRHLLRRRQFLRSPMRRRRSPIGWSRSSVSATRSRRPTSRNGRSARRFRGRSTRSRRSARKTPFEADQVQRVTVRLAPSVAAVVDNRDIPDICLQHMVAVMLIDKTVSFHAAHDKARMQDAAVLRQRAKVKLVRDEELWRSCCRCASPSSRSSCPTAAASRSASRPCAARRATRCRGPK